MSWNPDPDDEARTTSPPPPWAMVAPPVRMLVLCMWPEGCESYPVVAIAGRWHPDRDEPGGWAGPDYCLVFWCARHQRFAELSDLFEWQDDPAYEIVMAPWPPDQDEERLAPLIARLRARAMEEAAEEDSP
jgi:hypothetical protein